LWLPLLRIVCLSFFTPAKNVVTFEAREVTPTTDHVEMRIDRECRPVYCSFGSLGSSAVIGQS